MTADLFVGLMSGTSGDAVDAVLVRFHPQREQIAALSLPVPKALRTRVAAVGAETPLQTVAQLDVELAELFAQATQSLLEAARCEPSAVRALGCHGQTVWHAPDDNPPFTIQLGDPNVIAERTGIATVADFRRRDIAAGGQGAPLAPAFHRALFETPDNRALAVLNLGGIANISIISEAGETGFDTGPANALLDRWIQACLGQPFDRDGAWAASGQFVPALLDSLLNEPYFRRPPPKSTGLELFNLAWLERRLAALGMPLAEEDVQATLAELTARTVADAYRAHAPKDVQRLLVCGGGARNTDLLSRLSTHLSPVQVQSTAALGVDPDYVEAWGFAWLAQQTLQGLPGNRPSATGARRPVVLGGIYPA